MQKVQTLLAPAMKTLFPPLIMMTSSPNALALRAITHRGHGTPKPALFALLVIGVMVLTQNKVVLRALTLIPLVNTATQRVRFVPWDITALAAKISRRALLVHMALQRDDPQLVQSVQMCILIVHRERAHVFAMKITTTWARGDLRSSAHALQTISSSGGTGITTKRAMLVLITLAVSPATPLASAIQTITPLQARLVGQRQSFFHMTTALLVTTL